MYVECRGNYSATSNNMTLVHWPLMGGLLHLVQRGGDWAGCGPSRPLLAVPNVTVHPSTATVPITVLLYDGPLLWGFNMAIKGLTEQRSLCPEFYNVLFLRFSRSLHIYTTSAMPDCGPLYCCLFVLALRLDVGWDSDADRWWGAQTGWWCRCVWRRAELIICFCWRSESSLYRSCRKRRPTTSSGITPNTRTNGVSK